MRTIDSTVVAAHRRTSPLSANAETRIDMKGLAKLPTIMGAADPLRFIKLLPSVQTGSEIDAGIHIQGCDHGHNVVSIDGAPVYGATHLLGLFSVFNPSNFKRMDYRTMAVRGRLGGSVDMVPDRAVPQGAHADLNIGLIAAQGTVSAPVGQKSALSISGRRTFLNQLYKPYLKVDGDPFTYGFGDVNLAWVSQISPGDRIYADVFYGSDAASYTSEENNLLMDFDWKDALAALHWDHRAGDMLLKQSVFASATNSVVAIRREAEQGDAPAYTRNYGYRGSLSGNNWEAGAEFLIFDVLPQHARHVSGFMVSDASAERQNALDGTLYGRWTSGLIWQHCTLSASLAGNWYLSPERTSYWSLSPSISLKYDMFHAGALEFKAGTARQNIFLTGITSLGFPIEFNFMAGKYSDPQKSIYSAFSYNLGLMQEAYALSAEIYWRRLYNQVEYGATILDYLRPANLMETSLIKGDGWNYGLNLILHKQAGRLTGWMSYTLGRSMRRTEDGDIYPSNFERIHELDVAATYSARRWDAGGTLVAASGTPFTAPEAIYLTGSQLICRYGPHNGARLAPYLRMDLNFNWYFRNDDKVSHGVNFSVYNVLARDNEISYKFMLEDGAFAYRPFCFALKMMPGLGWFYKF